MVRIKIQPFTLTSSIRQVTLEVDAATAAAATEIQMNNQLHELRHPPNQNQNVEENTSDGTDGDDADQPVDEPADAAAAQMVFTGEMTAVDIANLSQSDHKKYTVANNQLIACAGVGAYTFHSPGVVRCNLCARNKPQHADRAKPRGGGTNDRGGAIIRLRKGRPFDVSTITYLGSSDPKSKRQIGHHHLVHGYMKDKKESKAETKKTAKLTAQADQSARWKSVFGLKPNHQDAFTLPSITLINQFIEVAQNSGDDKKIQRGRKMEADWEDWAWKEVEKTEEYVSVLT